MKKVNFLGLIQRFLFSKSLFNKGDDAYGAYRLKELKGLACNLTTGGNTAFKPPRNQTVEVVNEQNSQQLAKSVCASIAGGATAYKPPRVQSEKDSQG